MWTRSSPKVSCPDCSFPVLQLWTTRMWWRRARRRRRRTSCWCPRKTRWSTGQAAQPASPTRRHRRAPRATACWPRTTRTTRCGTVAWSTSGPITTCWAPRSMVLVSVSKQEIYVGFRWAVIQRKNDFYNISQRMYAHPANRSVVLCYKRHPSGARAALNKPPKASRKHWLSQVWRQKNCCHLSRQTW